MVVILIITFVWHIGKAQKFEEKAKDSANSEEEKEEYAKVARKYSKWAIFYGIMLGLNVLMLILLS